MNILFIITSATFFSLSIIFFVLYQTMKNKWFKTDQKLQDFKNELTSTKRYGFYDDTVNLVGDDDRINKKKTGDPYNIVIYVKELDRYTNGMSKIEITNLEVTSGYNITQYEYVKSCIRMKFQSLKKTSEIEWLEVEESLKEIRKQKLEKIINAEKR